MLKINNVEMPAPKKFGIERNKLWSQNSGRLDNGYFVGDLLGIKRKLIIEWPPLKGTDAQTVITAVSQGFTSITFTNEAGAEETGDFYFGDGSGEAYSWNTALLYTTGLNINAIER